LNILAQRLSVFEQETNILVQDIYVLKQEMTVFEEEITVLAQEIDILPQEMDVFAQEMNVLAPPMYLNSINFVINKPANALNDYISFGIKTVVVLLICRRPGKKERRAFASPPYKSSANQIDNLFRCRNNRRCRFRIRRIARCRIRCRV